MGRRLRRTVALLTALTTGTAVLALAPVADAQEEPPAPEPAAYACDVDGDGVPEDEAGVDAAIVAAIGEGHSLDAFTASWSDRLRGVTDIAGMSLDDYLARESLPAAIEAEGYHGLDQPLQMCLTIGLYDVLEIVDPSFPHPDLSPDAAMGMLYSFVFDNSWVTAEPEVEEAPPVEPPQVTLSAEAQGALETLEHPAPPQVITVPPAQLDPVPLIFMSLEQLQARFLNPVNQLFENLGKAITRLGQLLRLPAFTLPAISTNAVVDLARLLADAATYRVCFTGGKWGSQVRCSAVPLPFGLDVPVPLGTPVMVDLVGDNRPDYTATLLPKIGGGGAIGYVWRLQRNAKLLSGIDNSTPIPAHVFAVLRPPVPGLELTVGTDGTDSTLAKLSQYDLALTDPVAAAGGDVNLAVDAHHREPGARSGISFGATFVDEGDGTTPAVTTFDTGTLDFTPVPASSPSGPNSGLDNAIEADIQLLSADLDNDTTADSRAKVELTMPQPGVVLDATILSKQAPAGDEACCPFREIVTKIDALPTSTTVVVDSFPATRITDATYDANTSIGQVDLAMREFDGVTGPAPTGAVANTFDRMTAKLQQIPTHAHVRFTAPDPELDAKTTVVHYDANASIPHAELVMDQWKHGLLTGAAELQRRTSFKADTIPTVIDVTNTTTELSERASTGDLAYQANGSVTNVALDLLDIIDVSHLQATVASLPKAIKVDYDMEQPEDTVPATPGYEDPGHTVVHVDGRNLLTDARGSAAFGQMALKLRSRVSDFLVPDPSIANEEHAVINLDPKDPANPKDDTTQVDLRYGGLRSLDAEVLENGRIAATVRNDVEKKFFAQVNKPDLRLSATVDKLPKQLSFVRELVGGNEDHQKITYTGCTPTGPDCLPKRVDGIKVRMDGVIPAGSIPETAPQPPLYLGEFIDATVSDVPSGVTLDLDTPDTGKQTIQYDGAESTGTITAALHKAVKKLGMVDVAAEVIGVPTHFDATFGEKLPITFSSGAGQAIGQVSAAVSNTGATLTPPAFAPHAAVTYQEAFGQNPTLQASLGIKNLSAFSFDSGAGDGSFTGSLTTTTPGSNPEYTITADVLTLATDDADNPINDLNQATVIRTGTGGMVLDPLPTNVAISKTGGEQPNGSDTSTLTIDTTGSTGHSELVADVAIGAPDGVADALNETLSPVQGVHVGDGSAPGESDAIRLKLQLPEAPTKSVVRYGQITQETPLPADPQASFDISGFGTLPGNDLDIALDLDEGPVADRMHATVGLGGAAPALGFFRLFPLALVPNDEGDLDLEVRSASGAQAGPLDIDLRMGEDPTHGAARPESRIVVHTDTLPERVVFEAALGKAAEPDLAVFKGQFRDGSGGLTRTPGHTTVQYQTPAADGTNLADTPPSKVTLDLKEVPSRLDFAVKTAASVKHGNPNETCGLKESDFVLPTIAYTSEGHNVGNLDAVMDLDVAFIEPGGPRVKLDIVDLANGFTITNTDEGGTFNLENPGATTGKVAVEVVPFDIGLLDIDWTGCGQSTDFISWEEEGRATVKIKPEKLALQVDGLEDVELKPGFSTGVTGLFDQVSLSLPNPQVELQFSGGFSGGVRVHFSDDVTGKLDVFAVPNGTVNIGLPVVFHIAEQTSGPWFNIITPVPCPFPPVPGFFLHAVANIKPHRVALSTNTFTVTEGTWTITADPFGASALGEIAFGIDLIDTIAGLFSSPYDHGIQAPSLDCEFFL